MKTFTTVALMGVIFAAGLGVATVSGVPVTLNQAGMNTMGAESSGLFGHLTVIAQDSEGNIIDYRQFDNTVLNDGEDCLAAAIFTITSGTPDCENTSATMDVIAIGTGDQGSDGGTTQPLQTADGLLDQTADERANTVVLTPSSGSGSSTVLTAAFAMNNTVPITEAGLANSGSNGTDGTYDALAVQEFDAINLNNGDTLTVEWTIQLGS